MATKKGIIITIVILVVIAGASFAIWLLPQNHGSSFVVSDYKSELDSVQARHSLITVEMESNLKELLDKTMTPDEFISKAQASSSQVTSLISEMIESNPPAEWNHRYGNYFESLKKYNDYLAEAITLASKMKEGISPTDFSNEISKLHTLKKESDSLAIKLD
jgi:hypothetical protein